VAAGLVGIAALAITLFLCGRRAAVALRRAQGEHIVLLTWCAMAVGGFVNAQGEALLLAPGSVGAPAFWVSIAMLSALGLRAQASSPKNSDPTDPAGHNHAETGSHSSIRVG
jgi:hypothetical protein